MKREILMSPADSGLSMAVTKLQAHMHGSLPWIEKSFGLATDGFRKNAEKLTLKVPEVYVGNGNYHEVLPDGKRTVSQVFYYADSAEQVVDETIMDGYRMKCRVSMVVWLDLDRLKAEMGYTYDHRYTDELKKQALNAINSFPDYRPKAVESKAQEVWKGWTIGRGVLYYGDTTEYAMTQIFKHPEAGFRVFGELEYEETCDTYILPSFGEALPVTIVNRFGESYTIQPSENYVEAPVEPAVVVNPNENTTIELGEGETHNVPLVTVQDVYSLEFNFLVDHDNVITATIAAGYAATYTTQALSNVATVAYKKNGAAAALPIAAAANDVVEVTITRTNAAAAAKVTINS